MRIGTGRRSTLGRGAVVTAGITCLGILMAGISCRGPERAPHEEIYGVDRPAEDRPANPHDPPVSDSGE